PLSARIFEINFERFLEFGRSLTHANNDDDDDEDDDGDNDYDDEGYDDDTETVSYSLFSYDPYESYDWEA
ncbi:unnamed protein product, partial [Didymodactylos carnosus]